ncbi:hypothetical protein FRB95_014656 [Tulasnella sp. JGI-2019a]|nr:hypothetical protein FRB95_014656 [Tulasnella sp. JGI-2019a]
MGPLPTRGPNTPPDDLAKICDLSIDYPDHVVEETIVWLARFVADLSNNFADGEDHQPDEIILAERGLSEGSELNENEREWRRQRDLNQSSRYRLGAGKIVTMEEPYSTGRSRQAFTLYHPLTCLYFCVALDRRFNGTHNQEIIELLHGLKLDEAQPAAQSVPVTGTRGRIDEINTILGKSTLARALRRMGRVPEAERIEDDTAEFIRSRLAIAVPSTIRANLLGKDEDPSSSPILKLLGPTYFSRYTEHPYVAGKGWYMDVRDLPGKPPGTVSKLLLPSDRSDDRASATRKDPPVTLVPPCEVDKADRGECWVSGCRVTQHLKLCARCNKASYCSREHQLFAWKQHKSICFKS